MLIKTAASFFKENRQAGIKLKVVAENFPSKIVFVPEKSGTNTVICLLKSAKKLDGEETRTILLNGHKTITSNRLRNMSALNVHTCFLEEVQIEGCVVTKASTLQDGIGLVLAVVFQVEVRHIIVIHLHVLSLWFTDLLLNLFFLWLLTVYFDHQILHKIHAQEEINVSIGENIYEFHIC